MATPHPPTRTHLAVLPAPSPALDHLRAGELAPALDVVIPVHNEQLDLERSVLRLYAHLKSALPYTFRITIADNASTDLTWDIASRLACQLAEVSAVHLDAEGPRTSPASGVVHQ